MKIRYHVYNPFNANNGVSVTVEKENIPRKGELIEFPVNVLGEPEMDDFMRGVVQEILHYFNDENEIVVTVELQLGRYFKND